MLASSALSESLRKDESQAEQQQTEEAVSDRITIQGESDSSMAVQVNNVYGTSGDSSSPMNSSSPSLGFVMVDIVDQEVGMKQTPPDANQLQSSPSNVGSALQEKRPVDSLSANNSGNNTPLTGQHQDITDSSLIVSDPSGKSGKPSFKFFLKPKQRELRHLRAIHVRNIKSLGVLSAFSCIYIGEYDEIGVHSRLIFKSGVIEQSVNPSWNFELTTSILNTVRHERELSSHRSDITDMVVKIFSTDSVQNNSILSLQETSHPSMCPNESEVVGELLCEEIFDFNSIAFAGVSMKDLMISDLPLNCILLEFVDGIFISERVEDLMKQHGLIGTDKITRKSFRVDHSSQDVPLWDLQYTVEKLCGTQYAIEEAQNNISQVEENIKKEIERRQKLVEYRQQIELRKSRIKRLRSVIDQTKQSIEDKKNKLKDKKESLKERHRQLVDSQQDLLDQRITLSREQAGSLSTQKEELSILEQKYKHRQAMIVQQLSSIYMIGPHPQKQTNDLYINGLTICRGEQPNNDDEAASALGFVAHCVRILSKLFQIPLKYQIYALSSRSFVSEEGQNDQNVLLPLFMLRGSERTKYYKAIILLNLNLQHILKLKGFKRPMKSERKFDVLDNLHFLFKNLQK